MLTKSERSFIYREKRIGPKILPWGTPSTVLTLEDTELFNSKYCSLSDKKIESRSHL